MSIFDGANKLADDLERRFLSGWFDFDTWGDPVTWLHHTLWSAAAMGWGALIGWPFGYMVLGAQIAAGMALVFYIVREAFAISRAWGNAGVFWRGGRHKTGWMIDGVMDCVGPALVFWMTLR
jgi:hypothetical protein